MKCSPTSPGFRDLGEKLNTIAGYSPGVPMRTSATNHSPVLAMSLTHAGAVVDLVMENPSGETVALEIKRILSPKPTPGFVESLKILQVPKG